jgi:hypothetical protein
VVLDGPFDGAFLAAEVVFEAVVVLAGGFGAVED